MFSKVYTTYTEPVLLKTVKQSWDSGRVTTLTNIVASASIRVHSVTTFECIALLPGLHPHILLAQHCFHRLVGQISFLVTNKSV